MQQVFCEVESTDKTQLERWHDKHQFKPDAEGKFPIADFEGKNPTTPEILLEQIRKNVSVVDYEPLYALPYDERIFVMVCGGPSLAKHLEEIREKALQPDRYLVVCSNMTASYLLEHGITPHVHFIIDPLERKKFDVAPGKTNPAIQYWMNAACHPAVFEELKAQSIKPYMFLADFSAEEKAVQAVKESMRPGQVGMMSIQGGTMAGLRAMNLADGIGFRSMEYYGFDATVEVADGVARPYAYKKKRGEVIIEVTCDLCPAKFDTTLILQSQVNEFLSFRQLMPWMDIKIIGGGLIDHAFTHLKEREASVKHAPYRYSKEYAEMQKELHKVGDYGVTGRQFIPTIFHGVSQLAKAYGAVKVLDYGSARGDTMKAVREHLLVPPVVTDKCYDPFIDGIDAEPEPADFVICTDVLEHVEPECTKAVLDHLQALTKKLLFCSISLREANKTLSDGRNAHINLRPPEYWLKEIKRRFVVSEVKVSSDGETLLLVAESLQGCKETIERTKPRERSA